MADTDHLGHPKRGSVLRSPTSYEGTSKPPALALALSLSLAIAIAIAIALDLTLAVSLAPSP